MKPKTIFQKRVVELSASLPPLTDEQKQLAYKHSIAHVAKATKAGIVCLECGQQVQGKTCHHCGMKLTIDKSRKRAFHAEGYFAIYTTTGDYQVFRFFNIRGTQKVGQRPEFFIMECAQRWIDRKGNFTQMGLLRNPFGNYRLDSWVSSSDLEIRNNNQVYDIVPDYVLPGAKFLPEIKRNGFRGFSHHKENSPFEVCQTLLSSPIAETLLKAGQKPLFAYYASHNENYYREPFAKHWDSIKICMRNSYVITDTRIYFDYLDLLAYFGKDMRNAHYVCPADLNKAHDRMMEAKRRKQKAEEYAAKCRKAQEEEADYKAAKGKYFGFTASDDLITVQVLDSVQAFIDESEFLHHCVYQNNYHKKDNSLILSARIGGKRIETIELCLKRFKVEQARGLCNVDSKHHSRIVTLVNSHAKAIKKLKRLKTA